MARMFFRSITANSSCGVPRYCRSAASSTPASDFVEAEMWVWISMRGNFARSTCDSLTCSMLFGSYCERSSGLGAGGLSACSFARAVSSGEAPAINPAP